MKKTGIIIGRFQVEEVPSKLVQLIAKIQSEHDVTGIVIGVSKVLGSKINPLDYDLRRTLLTNQFPNAIILALDDMPSDEVWSQKLDQLVEENFPKGAVYLYGSEDGFVKRYSGKFATEPTGLSVPLKTDPEKMRDEFGGTADFRRGVIYSTRNTYPKVYPTVDVALFRENKTEILMGMKENDKKWRLIGGLTDPTDNSYEDAAKRELKEESGIEDISGLQYERSFKIDDWRYRHEEDKIISCLFSADFVSGEAKGNDDLAEVQWVSVREVSTLRRGGKTAAEHDPLLTYLVEKYSPEGPEVPDTQML